MAESKVATTYPTEGQYERWKNEADNLDMSTSEFIRSMTEAGMKKFTVDVEPDETNHEIRQHRNDLKEELEHSRERVKELEEQVYRGEKSQIENFIQENPGSAFGEIVQEVIDTAPERVNRHLEDMEGDSIRSDGEVFYHEPER
jgi:ElaB/YqjD/DUF883 family membrane-anchored ribosome-binding protein